MGLASAERGWRRALPLLLAAVVNLAAAQTAPAVAAAGGEQVMSESEVTAWLQRLHDVSRRRNFVGTFVVSSSSGALASARIWHACEGDQQFERVETLTGSPRSVFRRNDRVVTFLPESRVARTEQRESLGAFPGLLKSLDANITGFYNATPAGRGRVAGFDADIVQLTPKDALRFGYRVWSASESALVLKVQTLDTDGGVLEQAAFSELQFDAPVQVEKLEKMMQATEGWRVETPVMDKTTPEAMGWSLENPVPGFQSVHCFKRALSAVQTGADALPAESAMHWVFSDGLASVSLFIEPFDARRHGHAGRMAMGATHTLTQRVGSSGDGVDDDDGWWLTAVGEVPFQTLQSFGRLLRRVEPKK